MTAPRIAPGGLREVGPFAWGFSQVAGVVSRTNAPRLFLTMGRQHKLFRGWLRFAGRLMPGGSLPRRETELVILRVAHLRNCAYEFDHHVRLGRRAGVTADDVDRLREGPDAEGWTEREGALLRAVDMLHDERDLDDATWTKLRTHLDEPTVIEFLLLVGHYEMLATFLLTLRVQPDSPR
jgi:AhpD family alkylhydroperoxidase